MILFKFYFSQSFSLSQFALVFWLGLVAGDEEHKTGIVTSNRVPRQMLWSMSGLAGNTNLLQMTGIPSMSPGMEHGKIGIKIKGLYLL